MEHFSIKTDSDVVKDEGKNRFSRDTDVLALGSGKVIPGAVLGQVTASGKFKPLAPAASDGTQTAAAVILQYADATSADQSVVNLKRRAQVVLQALVWPEGITDTQKSAAIAQLKALGIVPRMGV
ncbi:head decoration protein [Rhizobium pusense]|uniref:head decoration protein n=1 Tax=Agrobacterium pusense TaxID=648995 RepID=UPI000D1B09FE|nr:head decoration protein [Agrobacterium pusense]MDH0907575.1 head decoration protein [Agrobacterium pusense]MDH1093658.1 head decoration protein [Agrobacterium pusense]MDH1110446.1 head decoration protein [Agrobacterium pusense]MDH2194986.1 head decoration protein [Agrobacterium pusense]